MDRHNPHTGGILLIIDRVVVINRNSWRYKWAEKSCLGQALISRIRSVRLGLGRFSASMRLLLLQDLW